MPTYIVTTKPCLLNDEKKERIAQFITKTHTEITNAPNYFAQIIFREEACRYIGGHPANEQIWIRADIRAGRSSDKRSLLIKKIVEGVAEIAEVPESDLWVFLNNLDPTDMAEYGKILSEPGHEQEWFSSLPLEIQKKLSEINSL